MLRHPGFIQGFRVFKHIKNNFKETPELVITNK